VVVYASDDPVSAYEQNAFYVSSAVQGTLRLLCPRASNSGRLGYQWTTTARGERNRPAPRRPHPRLVRRAAPARAAQPLT